MAIQILPVPTPGEKDFAGRKSMILQRRLVIAIWCIVLVAISFRVFLKKGFHNTGVYDVYVTAARNWIQGRDLYGANTLEYRYSPPFAVCFTPFTLFGDRIGSLLWRLFNTGVYVWALAWFARALLPPAWDERRRLLFFLLVLPLSVGCLNNAQANPIVTGLMLMALAAVWEKRWNLAAAFLVATFFLKIYPFAMGLILLLFFPRQLLWRQIVMVLAVVALCFLAQSPHYVAGQFAGFFHLNHVDMRINQAQSLEAGYHDLRLLLRSWRIFPGDTIYTGIQLLGAAASAAACLWARRLPQPALLRLVYALTCCWILLLGPASESATYLLLAPVLAWELIEAWTVPRSRIFRGAMLLVCALLLVGIVAVWFPHSARIQVLGEQPLATLIFLDCVLFKTGSDLSRIGPVGEQTVPAAASV